MQGNGRYAKRILTGRGDEASRIQCFDNARRQLSSLGESCAVQWPAVGKSGRAGRQPQQMKLKIKCPLTRNVRGYFFIKRERPWGFPRGALHLSFGFIQVFIYCRRSGYLNFQRILLSSCFGVSLVWRSSQPARLTTQILPSCRCGAASLGTFPASLSDSAYSLSLRFDFWTCMPV